METTALITRIAQEIQESLAVKAELGRRSVDQIADAATLIVTRLQAGGKLIAFGNGGSAADAQHFVAELVGRFRAERKPFAAIALTTNTSSITGIGNDYGFEEVFARQLEGIGRAGDLVMAISTSRNSSNIVRAIETAKRLGMATIALTGGRGVRPENWLIIV
jgi:D-sedoheptulose 7-phosphate isomerase